MGAEIVYLDIDGVLCLGRDRWRTLEPELAENLATLCRELNLKIVLNSAWNTFGLQRMRELLGEYGVEPERLIRTTDCTSGSEAPLLRDLALHKAPFIAIDDSSNYTLTLGRLVHTSFDEGFTEKKLEEALSTARRVMTHEGERAALLEAIEREQLRIETRTPWLSSEYRGECVEKLKSLRLRAETEDLRELLSIPE